MIKIASIILAAGLSSRFAAAGGVGSKLAAPVAGKPLARHAAGAALASRARPVVAVTGHARGAVEEALAGLPLVLVHNARYASGLASSLQAGIAALPADVAGAVILLGDMPAVGPALIDALVLKFAERPDAMAAAPTHDGRRGNPVLLSRALFAAIASLEGDEGARRLLAALPAESVLDVPTHGLAASLDVDTPEALTAARRVLEG